MQNIVPFRHEKAKGLKGGNKSKWLPVDFIGWNEETPHTDVGGK